MKLDLDIILPLDHFTLRVRHRVHAHITGLFGPSGAGKTSLLETIAGLRRGARGRIVFDDRVWLDTRVPAGSRAPTPPEDRDIGYLPQDGLLFAHRDVRGNLLAGAPRARRRGLDPRRTLEEVCDLLELGPLLGRGIRTLSGGERRRVALGRAICSGPRLLLLDEPLAALDQALRSKILPYLLRLRRDLALPMILVSHDPAELLALCDEVIALRQGAISAIGPPRKVLGNPDAGSFTGDGDHGFENLLTATIATIGPASAETGTRDVEVTLPGGSLGSNLSVASVTSATGSAGDRILLGVPARAIWLTRESGPQLSTQLAGVCSAAARYDGPCAVDGGRSIVATLTDGQEVRAWCPEPITLRAGDGIFLLIRGADCTLYPAG